MNLTKDPKNPERLKADLDTIQRDFGVLSGTIATMQAQITALQAATALGVPIIQPNSTVRTFKNQNGTPTVPFGGSTPVPPTLTFPILTFNIPVAAISANFFGRSTTPLTMVSAVAGVTHVPLFFLFYSKITGPGGSYTNGATVWEIIWQGNTFGTLPAMTIPTTMGWNAAPVGGNFSRSFSTAGSPTLLSTNNVQNPTFTGQGKALQLASTADVSGGSAGVAGCTLFYCDLADSPY